MSVNAALARIFGYASPEEMLTCVGGDIGHRLYAHPDDRAVFARRLEANGKVKAFEAQSRRKDGSLVWTRANARAVRDAAGALLYFEGFLEDITERKRAEARFRQLAREQEVILGTAIAGLSYVRDRRVVWANAAHDRIFGYATSCLPTKAASACRADYGQHQEQRARRRECSATQAAEMIER